MIHDETPRAPGSTPALTQPTMRAALLCGALLWLLVAACGSDNGGEESASSSVPGTANGPSAPGTAGSGASSGALPSTPASQHGSDPSTPASQHGSDPSAPASHTDGAPPESGSDLPVSSWVGTSFDTSFGSDPRGPGEPPGTSGPPAVDIVWDFSDGASGWVHGYADYSPGMEESIAFEAGIEPLPAELGETGLGYALRGHNRSDDLFMYLAREITPEEGLRPGERYGVIGHTVYASRAPSGCFGIGGAPGESVFVKVGAAERAPEPVEVEGYITMNVDIGVQSEGGAAATVVGTMANGLDCDDFMDLDEAPWVELEVDWMHRRSVTPDADGRLWLLMGIDSGFEGFNEVIFLRGDFTFLPLPPGVELE